MRYSTVLIINAALRETADKLSIALDHAKPGDVTYTVPLSSNGETVTHFGAHTYATEGFFETLMAALGGSLPPVEWSEFGLTETDVALVLNGLKISAPGSPLDAVQFVDLNSADSARLQTLPDIGPALASAIIARRPWADLAELDQVSGIGPSTIAGWEGLAITGPRTSPGSARIHSTAALRAHNLTPI